MTVFKTIATRGFNPLLIMSLLLDLIYQLLIERVLEIWWKGDPDWQTVPWDSPLMRSANTEWSTMCCLTFHSQDLIVNSPLQVLYISLYIHFENLVLDQDNNFYLISLSILITCLLDNLWILLGEVTCKSFLGVEGLNSIHNLIFRNWIISGTRSKRKGIHNKNWISQWI